MQFTKSTSSGTTVLVVQGSLDGTTSPQLEAELQGPIQAKEPRAVLDFAHVPLVSSAALRVLLSAAKRMKKHGGRLRLCGLRPEVKQVFDISDLTAFFDIFPDQAAALDAAGSTPAAISPPVTPTAPVPEPTPSPLQTPLVAVPPPVAAEPVLPPPTSQPATPTRPSPTPAAPPPPDPHPDDADPGATISYPSAPRRQPAPPASPAAGLPLPVTSRPVPVAPPVPAVPPSPPKSAPPSPPPTPAPLRRPAPAVLAKAASVNEQPPPITPPPPPVSPPSGAAVSIQKHEPRTVPPSPDGKPRSLLPILAAGVAAVAVLAWLGTHLLGGKKRESEQTVRATPSPTASPAVKATATPSPTPAREVAAASPSPSATPQPTPPPTPVVVAAATPPPTPPPTPSPSPSSSPAGSKEGVTAATGAVDTNRANPENQAIREAVLHRIDAMPLPQADKDRLYAALERARGLGKLVTINFPNGRTNVSANDVASLNAALHRPATQHFLDDPSVVLVVLGFADVKGNDKSNKDVSELRARRVVEALRGSCNVANVIHSLGMGGQSLAGETLEKNRVVEVWAVLP